MDFIKQVKERTRELDKNIVIWAKNTGQSVTKSDMENKYWPNMV